MISRRSAIWLTIAAVIAIGVGAIWAFTRNSGNEAKVTPQPSVSVTGSPNGGLTSPSATSAVPQTYPVKVYFSKHPESDDNPALTFAVSRVSPDVGVATYAISQLIAGPTAAEKAAGYFSGLDLSGTSNCASANFSLAINGETATLQFCRDANLKGVVSDGQIESTIKATLMQFATVKKAVILNRNGNCLFDLKGDNGCKL